MINSYGIFLYGFYTMGAVIDLMLIFFQLGTVNQRIIITLLLIVGFGTIPILCKQKEEGKA